MLSSGRGKRSIRFSSSFGLSLISIILILALLVGFTAETATAAEATPATSPPTPANPDLILATTTSTQDSGLLDMLLPVFEERTGYKVKTIAVGSGAAMTMGERGEAMFSWCMPYSEVDSWKPVTVATADW
jgi:tungstate transport system substrate-binding protein